MQISADAQTLRTVLEQYPSLLNTTLQGLGTPTDRHTRVQIATELWLTVRKQL